MLTPYKKKFRTLTIPQVDAFSWWQQFHDNLVTFYVNRAHQKLISLICFQEMSNSISWDYTNPIIILFWQKEIPNPWDYRIITIFVHKHEPSIFWNLTSLISRKLKLSQDKQTFFAGEPVTFCFTSFVNWRLHSHENTILNIKELSPP